MKSKLKYYLPTHIDLSKSFCFRLFSIAVVLFYFTYTAIASPPFIQIVNNSKTNTSNPYGIVINSGDSITFNANTTDNSNTWNWYVDNVLQINPSSSLITSFSSGSYHYVSVNATNASGTSNNLTWGINVYPAIASPSQTIVLLNETPTNDFMNAIQTKDFPKAITSPLEVYVNLIGVFFYAIVWFIVFAMMWIKQGSINIPAVIGVIFGGLIITFLPVQYQLVSQALIVLGIFAIVYVFFKGRG